jgi:ATP-binding cassette subfamily A (ABC1) protein 3
MEEASALANKVAILAKRLLAVGTTAELEARYATYEVHFSARSREDALRARELMARVPGALTLEALFDTLAETDLEFAVERPALESVFLKVIREHKVEEEDEQRRARSVWATLKRLV